MTTPCRTCGTPVMIEPEESGRSVQCGRCARSPLAVVESAADTAKRLGLKLAQTETKALLTHLYRFFGDDDRLLYVGITHHPASRFSKHKREKPWAEIRRIELEHFPDRDAAETAERAAIQNEGPVWNVVHTGGQRSTTVPVPDTLDVPSSNGLIGSFFHSFTAEEDGCELVKWQGQVLSQVEQGFYWVELYEWGYGGPSVRKVIATPDMTGWSFYGDEEWMREVYDNSLSLRSERHFRHSTKSVDLRTANLGG